LQNTQGDIPRYLHQATATKAFGIASPA